MHIFAIKSKSRGIIQYRNKFSAIIRNDLLIDSANVSLSGFISNNLMRCIKIEVSKQ